MPGEEVQDTGLTLDRELRREMPACLDSISQEIHQGFQQMSSICERVQFLKLSELLREDTSDENEIACIRKLTSAYSEIKSEVLVLEVNRLRRFVKGMTERGLYTESWGIVNLLQWMAQCKLQETVPNLIIAIRMYLTMTVSVASCERSFSKLKLIRMYLRSTMSQNRLTNLAILSLEREQIESLEFDEVINLHPLSQGRRFFDANGTFTHSEYIHVLGIHILFVSPPPSLSLSLSLSIYIYTYI